MRSFAYHSSTHLFLNAFFCICLNQLQMQLANCDWIVFFDLRATNHQGLLRDGLVMWVVLCVMFPPFSSLFCDSFRSCVHGFNTFLNDNMLIELTALPQSPWSSGRESLLIVRFSCLLYFFSSAWLLVQPQLTILIRYSIRVFCVVYTYIYM